MSKQPSDKTMLARLKRECKAIVRRHEEAMEQANHYRVRATKAEQEAAEWRALFDQLLKLKNEGPSFQAGGERK